jgi:hypothetical protein
VRADIDKTLVKIDEVASNQEGIAVEEALILRGQVFVLCFARNMLLTVIPVPKQANSKHTEKLSKGSMLPSLSSPPMSTWKTP